MSFSLNEVEALARKAARGAGYSWGVAEEAGSATTGSAGEALMVWLSRSCSTKPMERKESICADRPYRPLAWSGGRLCPLMAGTALSDSASLWAHEGKVLHDVICPLLLVPFLAGAAQALAQPVTVSWPGVDAVTDGHAVSIEGVDPARLMASGATVSIQNGGALGSGLQFVTRAHLEPTDWSVLQGFAHRTYAPETEASRLKGAGAGLTDNT